MVVVAPESERLQLLTPFPAWDGRDFERVPLLPAILRRLTNAFCGKGIAHGSLRPLIYD